MGGEPESQVRRNEVWMEKRNKGSGVKQGKSLEVMENCEEKRVGDSRMVQVSRRG